MLYLDGWDGMGCMGWMVIIGLRSSKNTSGANKYSFPPPSNKMQYQICFIKKEKTINTVFLLPAIIGNVRFFIRTIDIRLGVW